MANKLSLALGVVIKQIESFGKMLFKCTGVRHYWIVNNSLPIVDFITKINPSLYFVMSFRDFVCVFHVCMYFFVLLYFTPFFCFLFIFFCI